MIEAELGWSRLDLALRPDEILKKAQKEQLEKALIRLRRGEPLQYIIGETEFLGCRLKVDKNVLIPRPETEELVRWIMDEEPSAGMTILDIGTGSGCIPIALAKAMPGNRFSGIDVSDKALDLARKNAALNAVNVTFLKQDILHPKETLGKFDGIVSNPPYVRRSEKSLMHKNVLEYEPDLALFVEDEDPLLFYRKILEFARAHLEAGGSVYFEINEFLEEDLRRLFKKEGGTGITFKKDGFGKTRMTRIRL